MVNIDPNTVTVTDVLGDALVTYGADSIRILGAAGEISKDGDMLFVAD